MTQVSKSAVGLKFLAVDGVLYFIRLIASMYSIHFLEKRVYIVFASGLRLTAKREILYCTGYISKPLLC